MKGKKIEWKEESSGIYTVYPKKSKAAKNEEKKQMEKFNKELEEYSAIWKFSRNN